MEPSSGKKRPRKPRLVVTCLVVVVSAIAFSVIIPPIGMILSPRPVRPAIRTELTHLGIALEVYENKYGEYPPDFTSTEDVSRHLGRVFPGYAAADGEADPYGRFVKDLRENYGLDATKLDPASALVFWLGGLPETAPTRESDAWIPAGFHADATDPFKPGLPRTTPIFGFGVESLRAREPDDPTRQLRYYLRGRPSDSRLGPYVYFKARHLPELRRYEYGTAVTPGDPNTSIEPLWYEHGPDDVAVPYLQWEPGDPHPATLSLDQLRGPDYLRKWRNPDSFQIIHPGLDGRFGSGGRFRYTRTGHGWSPGDFDNLCNFAEGMLEDEIE